MEGAIAGTLLRGARARPGLQHGAAEGSPLRMEGPCVWAEGAAQPCRPGPSPHSRCELAEGRAGHLAAVSL